jgi:glycosyltransferase involved in cell wall biosynthesis
VSEQRKLNILQIVSSSATSGAEKHVFSLSERLIQQGHHVEVVCPMGGWLPKELRESGIPVHESNMKGKGWLRTVGLVSRLAKERKIDVIHSHLTRATYFGAVGGMIRRVPAVATVHIANHDQIYKRMAFGRNRLIAVSNYVRGLLHGRGINDRYIDTVYNGTDFADMVGTPQVRVHDEFNIPHSRKLIGLVGRVCREKGHLEMVEAMDLIAREYPEAHAVFVGRISDGFEPEITDAIRAAQLQDRITLTGVRHDVPSLLDNFAFTTMPSHQETFGVAAIEANARGRAVVASRVGGLQEVVRHQHNGLLVDVAPGSIAEAMSYLLENDDERLRMGMLGRQMVEEKFTLTRMVEQLQQVYQRAVG